jgi:hypothetical protein
MGKSGNPAKRAQQDAEQTPADTIAAPEDAALEDFDGFWSARDRKRKTTTIMGETITLPPALPLQFEMEARRAERSRNERDVRKLVAILFGEKALDRWAKRGMDLEQFMVLLAWAPAVITGRDITLEQVADEVAKRMREDQPGEA